MFVAALMSLGVFGDREGVAWPLQRGPSGYVAWLMSNHKTGTFFARQLARAVESTPHAVHVEREQNWDGRFSSFSQFSTVGSTGRLMPNHDKVVNFVRDPFDIVVSGYLYHKSGQENDKIPHATPVHAQDMIKWRNGLHTLSHKACAFNLPVPRASERYSEYLRRVSTEEGLTAEAIRSLTWDLPAMAKAYFTTLQYPRAMHSVCLEDVMRAQHNGPVEFQDVLDHIGSLLGLTNGTITARSMFYRDHEHVTAHNPVYRLKLLQTVRKINQKWNLKLDPMSLSIGCAYADCTECR